jgi:hypothetical protein
MDVKQPAITHLNIFILLLLLDSTRLEKVDKQSGHRLKPLRAIFVWPQIAHPPSADFACITI